MKKNNNTILIIGNGPSTKELVSFGFDNIPDHIDTFGMGLAFKFYDRINWWPKYYICADIKIVKNNEDLLRRVIESPNHSVSRFFFPLKLSESPRLEVIPHNSTGDFAFRKAVEFGYQQIFIIGIDLDYKPLKEATRITRDEFEQLGLDMDFHTNVIYKVRAPITNHPNYFFDDYQDVGDIYSEPRGNSWHLLSWLRARELAESKKIPVRNIGSQSKLKFFNFDTIDRAFQKKETYSTEFPKIKASSIASDIYKAEKAIADSALKDVGDIAAKLEELSPHADGAGDFGAGLKPSLRALSEQIAASAAPPPGAGVDVSVIVPCFNAEAYLDRCLESLARQTLPQDRLEVICVDDCSTDATPAMLDRYRDRIANLRILRHAKNRKQGAARNTGLDAAIGRYVFFLDSDDFLRVDALEMMLNLVDDGDALTCQHVQTRFDKPHKRSVSNRHVKTTLARAALENTIGWWPFGILIRRDLLEINRIRFREGVYFEDIDFNIRVYLAASSHVVTKEALYYYIERDGSTVNAIDEKKLTDSATVVAHVFGMLPSDLAAEDRDAFRRRATSWLQLQARRIRDGAGDRATKQALAERFIAALRSAKVLDRLPSSLAREIVDTASAKPAAAPGAQADGVTGFRYNPWRHDFRDEFAGKAIFFCEVDYHIRSVAPIARRLKEQGVESVIVDASRSTSFTSNRPLPDGELPLYADVDLRPFNVAEIQPFATDAGAFVFSNDLTYTKRLIFENFGFGVPTFGFYEGINDDWNLDRAALRMPYRSMDYLLLPGLYQQGFYADRACRIVGLPNVRARFAEPVSPPRLRRAIINVNFTYGVLEDRRLEFLETAVQACADIGLDYVVSQHPADKADLSEFNVVRKSIYDLLDEGGILISRFSTTILEALAMGRPVVYHNPIGEKVPKFHQPLGAYSVASNVESLREGLKRELDFVGKGGDVRARAALCLHFHCHVLSGQEPAELAARAIHAVIADPPPRVAFKAPASCAEGRPQPAPNGAAPVASAALGVAPRAKPQRAPEKTAPVHDDFFLMSWSSALLVEPDAILASLLPGGAHAAEAERILSERPADDRLAAHFRAVLAHARRGAPGV